MSARLESFALPAAPSRTPLREASVEPFVSPPEAARQARLSVDIPATMLRGLKVRAAERGVTIRELVLALLQREGL